MFVPEQRMVWGAMELPVSMSAAERC